MSEINGNLDGIRSSVLKEMTALYDYPVERSEFLPVGLGSLLAEFSSRINREISLYIARNGTVLNVTVGFTDNVPLARHRLRRSDDRLSGVRCIHTHPGGPAELSDVDITALRSLLHDAMCAIGIDPDGRINGISAAFLGERINGIPHVRVFGAPSLEALPQEEWLAYIQESDAAVQRLIEPTANAQEKALLVGIDSVHSLDELEALSESAGLEVVGRSFQAKARPDPALFVGTGKAEELALDAQALEADVLIVDDELTGSQQKRLEEAVGIKVVDRTTLILDIFAQRAKSSEGKLQVELAQLSYRATRLVGLGTVLSRLGGGVGTRGPGESKLETDRRHIRRRVNTLKKELAELEKQRSLRQRNRARSAVPVVALVGYTNTGKSTLLNRMADADVFVKDQLFATLDAVSRRVALPDGGEFVLVDSVGFISKLPTDLVEAFHSTLEEAVLADVLLVVSDASSPDCLAQRDVVHDVLEKLGADDQPRIDVLNKSDIAGAGDAPMLPGAVRVSALTGEGIDALLDRIAEALRRSERRFSVFVPFSDYGKLDELRRFGRIVEEQHDEHGTVVNLLTDPASAGRLIARYGNQIIREVRAGECLQN